jgi:hypothetical protein
MKVIPMIIMPMEDTLRMDAVKKMWSLRCHVYYVSVVTVPISTTLSTAHIDSPHRQPTHRQHAPGIVHTTAWVFILKV